MSITAGATADAVVGLMETLLRLGGIIAVVVVVVLVVVIVVVVIVVVVVELVRV